MMKVKGKQDQKRCDWCLSDPLYVEYHDFEWGVPLHEDRQLFEFLILEGAQAGLSWLTVLKKRNHYRKAFHHFDPQKIAKYDGRKVKELLQNAGIIRNRLKIDSAISNAKAFLETQKEFGSFDRYLWRFVSDRPIQNHWKLIKELPCRSEISDLMSKDLKQRGFRFAGTTICYAFMQAIGMVNDHLTSCFRYQEVL